MIDELLLMTLYRDDWMLRYSAMRSVYVSPTIAESMD